jgi:hypothetical protein
MRIALLGLALCACTPVADAPDAGGQASIAWGGGGGFSGGYGVTVTADDRIVGTHFGPFGDDTTTTDQQGHPGLFADLSALMATEGLAIQRAADPDSRPCEDHGGQYVIATPPVGGFSSISDDCPGDEAVSTFLQRVAAVVDGT